MSKVYCGDPVKLKMSFKDWQGDKEALVILKRDSDEPVVNSIQEVKNGDVEVKWPDLEKGTDYYGGAVAYLAGIKGDRNNKWAHQKYSFEVIVDNKKQESTTLSVVPIPDKPLKPRAPKLPCILYHREIGAVFDMFGFSKVPKILNPNPNRYRSKMGRFDIEFKEGEILITLAVKVIRDSKRVPADIFDRFKKTVESFWNGPNGFGKYAFHRAGGDKCVREKDCNCRIVYTKQKTLSSGGCCKFPVRLNIEDSDRHGQHFKVYWMGLGVVAMFAGAYAPEVISPGALPAKEEYGKINYPEGGKNTWAHEVGHCLGFPDQYVGGHLWDNHPKGKFPKKSTSIMGGLQMSADKDHLTYVEEFMGEDFEIIEETINR